MKIVRQGASFIVGGGVTRYLDSDRNPMKVIYIHLGFWTLYTNGIVEKSRIK